MDGRPEEEDGEPPVGLAEIARVLDETARLLRYHLAWHEARRRRAESRESGTGEQADSVSPLQVRALLDLRDLRARHVGLAPADPGWTMMLELLLARLERRWLSQSRLFGLVGLPATSGRRILGFLCESGMAVRRPNPTNERGIIVDLTDLAAERMRAYLKDLRGAGLGPI